MDCISVLCLPKRHGYAASAHVPPNIHVFHGKTLASTKKCHYIQVAEFRSDVISIINSLDEVEAAGCTPVCGAAAEAFHSSQSLAVHVPVWGVVVDGCILWKCLSLKIRETL